MNHRALNAVCVVFFFSFLFLPAAGAWGQDQPPAASSAAVTGIVLDQNTMIPIEGIEVLVEGADLSAKTDAEGRFRFENLAPGAYKIVFQSTKYERLVKDVTAGPGETEVSVDLKAAKVAVELKEVSVTARRETVDIAKQTIQKEEIATIPGAATDAVRAVQSMPGVANIGIASLGTPGLVIRGTGAEDSRYFLDGFDIPQLLHFGGLLTVVNSEWLGSIDYYAGGYSVKYGNAIGGIVELKTRPPNREKFSGAFDLTNYASFLLLESPLSKDGAWSAGISARRSFIDWVLPLFLTNEQASVTIAPRFYDFQASVVYKPSEVNSFELFTFGSDDGAGLVRNETDENMPTTTESFDFEAWFYRPILSWTYTPSSTVNNRLATAGNIQRVHTNLFEDKYFEVTAQAAELRDDLTINLADWNRLSIGANGAVGNAHVKANIIRPPKEGNPSGMEIFNQKSYLYDQSIDIAVAEGYVEDTFKIAKLFDITPGVRGAFMHFETQNITGDMSYFDPRAFVRSYITSAASLKASAGMYHQSPQADELMPPFGTLNLKPEVAYSYGFGGEYDLTGGYHFDAQIYYKQLDDMVVTTPTGSDEPYDNEGIGKIYGFELLAKKELTDRLYGWISYTYSVSRRRDRPGSEWRYFDQDQRHNFIILGSYKIGDTWRAGARFAYSTGTPYTAIDSAIYNADTDSYIPIFSDKINARRMPDSNQLDVRVDKEWPFKTWSLKTYLDIQNVYAMKQPIGYLYNYDYTNKRPVSWPTFYPTLGIQGRW